MDQHLLICLQSLWAAVRSPHDDLWSIPEFKRVIEACQPYVRSGERGFSDAFAFSNALKSLGLPLDGAPDPMDLDLRIVASRLISACESTVQQRTHYCPLDLAGELPRLEFGSATIRSFSRKELAIAFEVDRLAAHHPSSKWDLERLCQVQWLVVQEETLVRDSPSGRASPFFEEPFNVDWGAVNPHENGWPEAVTGAVFFLLLAPWEQWTAMPRTNIFGFQIPWIYTVESDLFKLPAALPSADKLTFSPDFWTDPWGVEHELEAPARVGFHDAVSEELPLMNQSAWASLQLARASPLFGTPVQHFLVRAFQANGVDEFLAHITAIEAAVGHFDDHRGRKDRTKANAPTLSTDRVGARLAALVGDRAAKAQFRQIFDLRSAFIHGRADLSPISTNERLTARRLARRAAQGLVDLAVGQTLTREAALEQLLEVGVQLTNRPTSA